MRMNADERDTSLMFSDSPDSSYDPLLLTAQLLELLFPDPKERRHITENRN
jgi:hypothetical protein